MMGNKIQIGKSVQWTAVSKRGKVVTMKLQCGTVTAINGDTATVKTPRDKLVSIGLARLRAEGDPSQITEFIEAVRGKI